MGANANASDEKSNVYKDVEINREFFIEHCDNINCSAHINSELEVLIVEKGSIRVICDGVDDTVNEGEAILILPFRIHGFEPFEGAQARVFMFSLSIVEEFYEKYRAKGYVNFRFVPDPETEKFIYYSLERYHERNDIFIIKALFFALVSNFLSCNAEQMHEVNIKTDIAHKIVEFIYDRLGEPLTLTQVSAELGISRTAFVHIFDNFVGMPFKKFLNNMRIQKAKVLLEKSDHTVTEISYECGFGSLRTFNRVFVSYMNCTPSDYRGQKCEPKFSGKYKIGGHDNGEQ